MVITLRKGTDTDASTIKMSSVIGFFKRNWTTLSPTVAPKDENAIKIGILGAANIAPLALIHPGKTARNVIVSTVAARDEQRATAFAKKNGIPHVHKSYDSLLDDPSVDAVYIPLPNGLHYEWSIKALDKGKHVLLEKPLTNNAKEAVELFAYAEKKGLILLEAFHWRFHPAAERLHQLIHNENALNGPPIYAYARLSLFKGAMGDEDIRFNSRLGGGALMDMGTYTLSCLRYFLGSEPEEVLTALPRPHRKDALADEGMTASIRYANGARGDIVADLGVPIMKFVTQIVPVVVVESESTKITFNNFIAPSLYHSITILDKKTGKKRTEKCYGAKGQESWTTYRYQLEAFADKLQGRQPRHWHTRDDSIMTMQAIDMVYTKSGLPLRGTSTQ